MAGVLKNSISVIEYYSFLLLEYMIVRLLRLKVFSLNREKKIFTLKDVINYERTDVWIRTNEYSLTAK